MRESEENGAPGGGRFDLLLKQLGAGVAAEGLGVELPEGGEGEGGGSVRQSSVRSTLKTRWDRSMGWVRSFPSSPIGCLPVGRLPGAVPSAVLPVPHGDPLPEDDLGGPLPLRTWPPRASACRWVSQRGSWYPVTMWVRRVIQRLTPR